MPSFKHEVELEVSAATMWAAMKDQNEIFPKIMPEAVSSIEIVEGEGGPGSVRLVKFGPSKQLHWHVASYAWTIIWSVLQDPVCIHVF